jgi:hypothetical protein
MQEAGTSGKTSGVYLAKTGSAFSLFSLAKS